MGPAKTTPRPRLLYVGDVSIRNDTSGGSIVLWRHQQRLNEFVLDEQRAPLWTANTCAWISLALRRCRLSRLELMLRPWMQSWTYTIAPEHSSHVRDRYVGILTVAHGIRWMEAMKLAELTGLPLISIFHDWYPDCSGCQRGCTWVWDFWFRRLYRRSALAFVVSPGMGRELGEHPNMHLLPPIPAALVQNRANAFNSLGSRKTGTIRLYYAGLTGGLYAPMLKALIKAVQQDERFSLRLSGSETEHLARFHQADKVEMLGFLNGDAWQRAFDDADLLLVVLPFDRKSRRHLRTHFPSKLVEYANRGRPILIWGPETSSAVSWARSEEGVLVCTSQHVDKLLTTAANAFLAGSWNNKEPLANTIHTQQIGFDPEVIHHKFESQLKRLIVDAAHLQ